jgi:hypothetical protein
MPEPAKCSCQVAEFQLNFFYSFKASNTLLKSVEYIKTMKEWFTLCVPHHHRVYRVSGFFFQSSELGPALPHPQGSVALWVQGGRHTRLQGKGWGARGTQFWRWDRHPICNYNPSAPTTKAAVYALAKIGWAKPRGVTKRCRLSWLTNSSLVFDPKCGGRGELRGLCQ